MNEKKPSLNPYLMYTARPRTTDDYNAKLESYWEKLRVPADMLRDKNRKNAVQIEFHDEVVDSAKAIESTFYKEIPAGISEEVIAYGLVHALSKQAEAIVGESELPLIKMTPSMLNKIEDHANAQLKALKDADWGNREGKRKRLVRFFEALVSLTER